MFVGLVLIITTCGCAVGADAHPAAKPGGGATKASPSSTPPQSLQFYMYIAVQNNSHLAHSGAATYTAVQSAQPLQAQPFSFGIIHTFDNPVHAAASLSSPLLGRAQGWYGDVGQQLLTLFLVQTFTFSSRPAGTFSLIGVDVATDTVKYGSIVGGTGDFAFARGVAKQTLVSTQIVNHQTVSWFHFSIEFKY